MRYKILRNCLQVQPKAVP